MLRGLKRLPAEITAIVTVADDGGSSGRLRNDMQMPPPGDLRNVLVALADTEPLLEKVLQYRFQNGNGLAGHNLGNLIIAALKDITGDFNHAIQEMSRVLAVRGRVLPSTGQDVTLKAEMADGSLVEGESRIPKSGRKIRRVFLDPPEARPVDEALEAIEKADGIVVGPGSLYTSILPNLLVQGMVDAIRASKAKKIYICNVMTQAGETDGYTAADHVAAIHRHVGKSLFDVVIVNDELPPISIQRRYAEEGASPVLPDVGRIREFGCEVLAANLIQTRDVLRHDASFLSRCIIRLIRKP
ncbi:uridine diphosphate-N-acetylglucosamine-binding protein YvcK [Salinithrix halophila]|uniref:Gluconeogenesis factor n=2 Tax=Salinithrix halophila TaxID=1485204 RepID=A0ABV8JGM1_9BACL